MAVHPISRKWHSRIPPRVWQRGSKCTYVDVEMCWYGRAVCAPYPSPCSVPAPEDFHLSLQICIARTWPSQLELQGDEHLRHNFLCNRWSFYPKQITLPNACKVPRPSVERERFKRIFCASYPKFCSAFTVFCCQKDLCCQGFSISQFYMMLIEVFRDLVAIFLHNVMGLVSLCH